MDLKGKVVVITGASRGLGKSLADAFHRAGAKVVVSARSRDVDAVAASVEGHAVLGDVTSERDMERLADEAVERFGRIDVWVNNAGVRIPHSMVEEVDWKRAHDMMEVNFFGTAYGSKAAMSRMKGQKSGAIVNILSTAALEGKAGLSAYAASKQAAKGFTESLRAEGRENGITVISVFPGGMRTEFFREQMPADYNDYMDPDGVAERIVENLEADRPEEELVIRRQKA